MRALFIAHAYPRYEHDPVGSFILRLATALRDHGIDTEVLAPSAPGLTSNEFIEGVRVHRYRYAPSRMETLAYGGMMSAQVRGSWSGRLAMVGLLTSALAKSLRLLREGHFDLVHAHWWFPGGIIGTGLRSLARRPLVTTLHGSDVRLARDIAGGARAFRFVARTSDALTTVSSWLAREAISLAPNANPIVAPMPVAPGLFHPGKARADNRLLFIGKLSEQKGLHHLLRALPMMRTRPVVDVVGAGRVDDAHLKVLAHELGVADRINWLPLLSQADLAERYREATLHVIPALDEGLGLTAIESLLCETPVVAFDSGGVPDAVVPGKTGILVPPGDTAALAAALDELLTNSAERARLGREGRALMIANFSPDAVAAHYASIYGDAVRHRRR
ncbi:MAG TPA: glycosyltransferase family 4 protein [Gemmatimonadaceae bacterium]|nr:glycosyltransferase family 4 protein [Gemmatimonadaceae bacterium]